MAAEDVRPDPLRASNSNVAKDHLHGLTLELDGVLPAPFQLAGANGPKEKRHARSERPTFAEPLVLPVSSWVPPSTLLPFFFLGSFITSN